MMISFYLNCSCPAHDTYGSCKHSVAVTLEILDRLEKRPGYNDTQSSNQINDLLTDKAKKSTKFNRQEDFTTKLIDLFSNQFHLENQDVVTSTKISR